MGRRIDTLVIHHSASATGDVNTIRALHKQRGYSDIGYHNVVVPEGAIQTGRPHAKVGAGVYGANTGKLHVCLIGQFSDDHAGYTGPPTVRQYSSLGWWLLVNGDRYNVTNPARVVGHGEVTVPGHGTACPGDLPLREIRLWFGENAPKFDAMQFTPLHDWLRERGVPMR